MSPISSALISREVTRCSCAWLRDSRRCADLPAFGAATRSDDLDPRRFKPGNLVRIVGQQPDLVDSQRSKHRRRMAIIALIVGKTEAQIRIDGIESAILQRIGAELVRQPDPATLLPQVKQNPPPASPMMCSAAFSCGPQSHFSDPNTSPVRHSLCSRTSGGFPPNAPISSATCSWPSSDAGRRRSASAACRPAEAGARDDLDRRMPSFAARFRRSRRRLGGLRIEQPQRRQQPGRTGQCRAPRGCLDAFGRDWMKRADRCRGRGPDPDRQSPSAASRIEPMRAPDQHRSVGSAASRSLARLSAAARSPLISSRARCSGSTQFEQLRRRSLDRQDRHRHRAVDSHGPPGAQRGNRRSDCGCALKPRSRRSAEHGPMAAASCGTALALHAP